MDGPKDFPFQTSFQEDKYLRWRHHVVDRLAKAHAFHERVEEQPNDVPTYYPRIAAAQQLFREYVEQCLKGLHPEAPPEFVACAEEVYEKSRVDWTKRKDYFAFEKWLAGRFP